MKINFFAPDRMPFLTTVLLQARLLWSIRLRWMAVTGFFIATWLSRNFFELPINYEHVWATLLILAGLNVAYYIILKLFDQISLVTELVILSIHIIMDLIFLTVLVHLTGGVENPIFFFYVFHVVLSSILFPRWLPLAFATFVVFLFSALVFVEEQGILHHHNVFDANMHQNPIFTSLMVIVFTITAYVTTYICMTFMRLYRESKRIIDIQNKQLTEAYKQKTQFFMFASHELKSPIIVVKSTIDAVLKTYNNKLEDKAFNLLKRASNRAGQMLEIIRELLELSKNNSVDDKNELVKIRQNALIEEIINAEILDADSQRVKIIKEFKPDAHNVSLLGRKADFEGIFLNLINNAVRYTNSGGSVRVMTDVKDNCFIVKVEDTGIGIKEEDIYKIFTEFYRSENARKAVNYGTGLGLSLVKKLVEKYSGTISVQSVFGKGSTFTITIPIN